MPVLPNGMETMRASWWERPPGADTRARRGAAAAARVSLRSLPLSSRPHHHHHHHLPSLYIHTGHLGASLGVTELTVALHYVFNAPADRIVWDVGHQVRESFCETKK
jgi:hypothetical protein